MARTGKSKEKLLRLIDIFEKKSDEEHFLSSQDIIAYLAEYGITVERKTIYSDIETLREYGYDICLNTLGKRGYYLASRKFEEAELMLLADTVAASKFMTEKKSGELIGKISSLASEYQSDRISRSITVKNRIKSMNESIYYSIDAVHQAIVQKKKIAFKYISYISENEKVFRHDGKVYVVSPYQLICDNENYYLIAGYEGHEEPLTTFRTDKMSGVEMLDEDIDETKENIPKYVKSLFGMYSGDVRQLTMEFDNSLISVVYDRFGRDIHILSKNESTFTVSVEAALSPVFFGWLCQFGAKVKIISPDDVADMYIGQLKEILERY